MLICATRWQRCYRPTWCRGILNCWARCHAWHRARLNTLKARPLTVVVADTGASDTPDNPAEVALFAALAKLFPGQSITRRADFFTDLGGHSLFAARLASALRTDPRFAHVTVRDIYHHRTIGRIAQALADVGAAVHGA